MRKKIFTFLVVGIILTTLLSGVVFAAQSRYKGFPVVNLILNGKAVSPSSPAINIDGTTYVPLRFVSESMGIKVGWNQATQTVTIGGDSSAPSAADNLTQTKENVTVTVALEMATASETQIRVTVTNNTSGSIDFPASLTQIVAGSTQFDEPKSYDLSFINDIKPGVTKSGVLKFPALPSGSKSFRVFLKVWDESINTTEFEFNIAL